MNCLIHWSKAVTPKIRSMYGETNRTNRKILLTPQMFDLNLTTVFIPTVHFKFVSMNFLVNLGK